MQLESSSVCMGDSNSAHTIQIECLTRNSPNSTRSEKRTALFQFILLEHTLQTTYYSFSIFPTEGLMLFYKSTYYFLSLKHFTSFDGRSL